MQVAVGLIVGAGLIFLGLTVLRDWWQVSSRVVRMQHGFLEMLGRRGDDQEQFLDDMRVLSRLAGGLLIAGGVYTLALACFVWR